MYWMKPRTRTATGQNQEIKSDEDMTAVMSTMSPAEMRMVFEGFMNTGSVTDSQKQLL